MAPRTGGTGSRVSGLSSSAKLRASKGALSEFSGLSYVDFEALEDFRSSIDLASRLLPTEATMDDAQTNALKVIPSFYCKKGKVHSLPSKRKCSSGFRKIKIDKTW